LKTRDTDGVQGMKYLKLMVNKRSAYFG
jgi:hypothetical protein